MSYFYDLHDVAGQARQYPNQNDRLYGLQKAARIIQQAKQVIVFNLCI